MCSRFERACKLSELALLSTGQRPGLVQVFFLRVRANKPFRVMRTLGLGTHDATCLWFPFETNFGRHHMRGE
jgi:hypothetical protein